MSIVSNAERFKTIDVFDTSLDYAALGWHVLPIWRPVVVGNDPRCSCRRTGCSEPGKHPRTRRGWKDASCDRSKLMEWFTGKVTGSNLAVATGSISGVVALDIDGAAGERSLALLKEELGQLPRTATALSANGTHLYFQAEELELVSSNHIFDGIDFRGDGGYLMLPPSMHATGTLYRWLITPDQTRIARLSIRWIDRLRLVTREKREVSCVGSRFSKEGNMKAHGGTEGTWRHIEAHGGSEPSTSRQEEMKSVEYLTRSRQNDFWARLDHSSHQKIASIVDRYRLTKHSTRNRTAFQMARELLAVPEIAQFSTDDPVRMDFLTAIFRDWYDASNEFTKTPYEAALMRFLEAVECVKVPGSTGVLEAAWQASECLDAPPLPNGTELISEAAQRLAAFIVAIDRRVDGDEFFLSGNDVAKYLVLTGSDPARTGRYLLDYLCRFGFIAKLKSGGRGKNGKLLANVYRVVKRVDSVSDLIDQKSRLLNHRP